ncbi:MAG: hypothetical protein O9327_02520 [Polaromonas sp.]|nr:hypothetical protein [Polaromonas sp.]
MQTPLNFETPGQTSHSALGAGPTPTNLAANTASGIGKPFFMGNWEVRSFHGFHQSREGGKGDWKFQISGFNQNTCNLLLIAGGTEMVEIDQNDRIKVLGQWYGRRFWNH